jgi:hypothetical protein
MFNISIYFYNIDVKHLQHTYEISETHKKTLATCAFSAMSPCYLNEWRLVVVELDGGIRSSPVQQ